MADLEVTPLECMSQGLQWWCWCDRSSLYVIIRDYAASTQLDRSRPRRTGKYGPVDVADRGTREATTPWLPVMHGVGR